jgi:hypothetical protein
MDGFEVSQSNISSIGMNEDVFSSSKSKLLVSQVSSSSPVSLGERPKTRLEQQKAARQQSNQDCWSIERKDLEKAFVTYRSPPLLSSQ